MKRAITLSLVLIATAVSAIGLAPTTRNTRVRLSEKPQWAPSGNFRALHTRSVCEGETRSGAGSCARENRKTAAAKTLWSYANLNPTRYTDPDGRFVFVRSTGHFEITPKDSTERLMLLVADLQMRAGLKFGDFANHAPRLRPPGPHSAWGSDEALTRATLASALNSYFQDPSTREAREDNGDLIAGRVGYYTSLQAADEGAEGTKMVAGLLGYPVDGKQDVAIGIAVPVIGKLAKLGGKALWKALGRSIGREGDDVLKAALRREEGAFAPHVGATSEVQGGKLNPINPSGRTDNCVAGLCALLRNKLERRGDSPLSADEIERLFGWAGRERQFTEGKAIEYINRALEETGHRVGGVVPFRQVTGALAPGPGHYVIFAGTSRAREHVVYGRILPNGNRFIYDPQLGRAVEWDELIKRYGAAVAREIEAVE